MRSPSGQPRVLCNADITNDEPGMGDGFDQTVDVNDLLELLSMWGPCGSARLDPQSVEDCLNMFDPETEPEALDKCIQAIEGELN